MGKSNCRNPSSNSGRVELQNPISANVVLLLLMSWTYGSRPMAGEVEGLIGISPVISDYCLLFRLKSWGVRGACNHLALWVIAGLLVKRFIVLTTLWMKEMRMSCRFGITSYCSIVRCESSSWLRLKAGAWSLLLQLKPQNMKGASHQPTFMSNRQTISHTFYSPIYPVNERIEDAGWSNLVWIKLLLRLETKAQVENIMCMVLHTITELGQEIKMSARWRFMG